MIIDEKFGRHGRMWWTVEGGEMREGIKWPITCVGYISRTPRKFKYIFWDKSCNFLWAITSQVWFCFAEQNLIFVRMAAYSGRGTHEAENNLVAWVGLSFRYYPRYKYICSGLEMMCVVQSVGVLFLMYSETWLTYQMTQIGGTNEWCNDGGAGEYFGPFLPRNFPSYRQFCFKALVTNKTHIHASWHRFTEYKRTTSCWVIW